MPVFVLSVKSRLENVAQLKVPEDYRFDITLRNCSSDETRDVLIAAEEMLPLSTGRGFAHFVMKWDKGSKTEATVNIVEIKGVTRPIGSDDSEMFVPLIGFECRGVEPITFRPGRGWTVQTHGGKVIEDVDLTDLDWCDFDEGEGVSVGVYEMESRFVVHRK